MQPARLDCPYVSHLTAPNIVQLLVHYATHNQLNLSPVWLQNNGQDIIGFMPKMAICLNRPLANQESATQLVSERYERQDIRPYLDGLKRLEADSINENSLYQISQSHVPSLDDLIMQLMTYQHQQDGVAITNTGASGYYDGLMGFISYDVAATRLSANVINDRKIQLSTAPLAYFGHYDIYIAYDFTKHMWQLYATSLQASASICQIERFLHAIVTNYDNKRVTEALNLNAVWDYPTYQQAFDQVQRYLYAGDCYQINLTQCWQGHLPRPLLLVDYLAKLHDKTHAPFAGYLYVKGYEIASCSPELFFTFGVDKATISVITKPIKGTRPRGQDALEDASMISDLTHSEKDRAENVMIVDLLRNDLGKYAQTGSVKVPTLFAIESFSNVHHMVSTITAVLKENSHPLYVLMDSLPAGSITGTPKKRAVEIIHELESAPRGAYCGTLGYMNFDGSGQWNVLIRTLQAYQQQVQLWAGGGITVASQCEEEYQECLDKVGNLLSILKNA